MRILIGLLMIEMAAVGCGGKTPPAQPAMAASEVKSSDLQQAKARIASIKKADLTAALADATAKGDLTGAQCWTTLLKYVDGAGAVTVPPIDIQGVASALQGARDIRRSMASGDPKAEDINRGCAPLFIEAQVTIAKLGMMVAGAGSGAGAAQGAAGSVLSILKGLVK